MDSLPTTRPTKPHLPPPPPRPGAARSLLPPPSAVAAAKSSPRSRSPSPHLSSPPSRRPNPAQPSPPSRPPSPRGTLSASSSTARSRSGSPPATVPTMMRTRPRSAAPRLPRRAPPPKHSLGHGGGAGSGNRRSAIDTAAPERPSLSAAAPSSSVANTGAPEKAETAAAAADEDSEDIPVPDQQEDGGQLGSDAGASQQQHQGYDAGAGSSSGYEAYAWDPNYYAQSGASYGWNPNGNANYATGEQYAADGGEQGGEYARPHGGEHVGGYANVAAVPYGADYAGGYGHEAAAATTFPPVQDPVIPPAMGRIGGKRGRSDMPTEIVEVNQAELMKNRQKQDTSRLTGLAFDPSYQPAPSTKGKPPKLHKRKHQIGSLYYDMKSKEMELAERRSKGILTKAETQAKYGW